MNLKFGLNSGERAKLLSVFSEYPKIERLIVYGSRAKGNYNKGSDIDICIYGLQVSLSEMLEIETRLDDLMLPYKIDLSLFHQIDNPDFREHIERVGVDSE